jgi:hypothetical protein
VTDTKKSMSVDELKEIVKEKLQPGKCRKCGFTYGEHAISTRGELELLRALGYAAFICRDSEDKPFGDYVEIVAVSSEGKTLNTDELEEMFKEPDDPCDEEFMEEISS